MSPKTANPSSKTVAVISLGCPKNTVDSEVMLGKLAKDNYMLVKDPADAEVVIVNTCGFIEASKKESIDTILDVAKLRKSGHLKSLVVGGCLAHRYGDDLKRELPEIDILFGLNDVENVAEQIKGNPLASIAKENAASAHDYKRAPMLPDSLNEATYVYDASSPRLLSTPGHFAYVKISEGCDLPCTFCIIPKIRGHYRSRSIEDIEQEAKNLAKQGVKELCLVAQDSTWYGSDRYGKPQIAQLLDRLAQVEGIEWVRLHYLYPSRVTDEMLDVMAKYPRITPYFDVPLQHASNRILKSMQRIGDRALLDKLIARIKGKIPHASIRSTFIVGFPGETDADFQELLDFLKTSELDYVGFFAYSKEENTPAGVMADQVPEKVKQARLAEAYRVQEAIAEKSHQRWVGETLTAVVESIEDGEVQGRTQYQAPEVDGLVLIEGLKNPKVGQWVKVEITHAHQQDLVGKAVSQGL
ncbi:MAG TPA: 30S ribosomal protein S12 methylthiotransferase RimO [bacterium]|jgi:ribosomal protein S12 methylthiotransferase|nr:30S ribosomal protein S12 methylthiotransferase RimO [bacterium]